MFYKKLMLAILYRAGRSGFAAANRQGVWTPRETQRAHPAGRELREAERDLSDIRLNPRGFLV